jgi:hypothetical protein
MPQLRRDLLIPHQDTWNPSISARLGGYVSLDTAATAASAGVMGNLRSGQLQDSRFVIILYS